MHAKNVISFCLRRTLSSLPINRVRKQNLTVIKSRPSRLHCRDKKNHTRLWHKANGVILLENNWEENERCDSNLRQDLFLQVLKNWRLAFLLDCPLLLAPHPNPTSRFHQKVRKFKLLVITLTDKSAPRQPIFLRALHAKLPESSYIHQRQRHHRNTTLFVFFEQCHKQWH